MQAMLLQYQEDQVVEIILLGPLKSVGEKMHSKAASKVVNFHIIDYSQGTSLLGAPANTQSVIYLSSYISSIS